MAGIVFPGYHCDSGILRKCRIGAARYADLFSRKVSLSYLALDLVSSQSRINRLQATHKATWVTIHPTDPSLPSPSLGNYMHF